MLATMGVIVLGQTVDPNRARAVDLFEGHLADFGRMHARMPEEFHSGPDVRRKKGQGSGHMLGVRWCKWLGFRSVAMATAKR